MYPPKSTKGALVVHSITTHSLNYSLAAAPLILVVFDGVMFNDWSMHLETWTPWSPLRHWVHNVDRVV